MPRRHQLRALRRIPSYYAYLSASPHITHLTRMQTHRADAQYRALRPVKAGLSRLLSVASQDAVPCHASSVPNTVSFHGPCLVPYLFFSAFHGPAPNAGGTGLALSVPSHAGLNFAPRTIARARARTHASTRACVWARARTIITMPSWP